MRIFVINTLVLVLLALVSVLVYIRIAPDPVAMVHRPVPEGAAPGRPVMLPGGYLMEERFALPPPDLAARLHPIITATPRTRLLAGDLPASGGAGHGLSGVSGRATYVTRSLVFGFPDYTTVEVLPDGAGGSRLRLFARLRYGQGDFGVNRKRVQGWLARLGPALPARE